MGSFCEVGKVWDDGGHDTGELTLQMQRCIPPGDIPVVTDIPSDADALLQRAPEDDVCRRKVHTLFRHHFGWDMGIRIEPTGQSACIANSKASDPQFPHNQAESARAAS